MTTYLKLVFKGSNKTAKNQMVKKLNYFGNLWYNKNTFAAFKKYFVELFCQLFPSISDRLNIDHYSTSRETAHFCTLCQDIVFTSAFYAFGNSNLKAAATVTIL